MAKKTAKKKIKKAKVQKVKIVQEVASNDDMDWKIRSATNTLVEAEEIKKDGKMMKHVRKEIKKRKQALGNI